ncbi:MAG: hypothetical protein AAFO99_07485 [Bacteroidota bacterium]
MKMLNKIVPVFCLTLQLCFSQQEDHPVNPYLADSPWPTYHGNSYRQSYSEIAGPMDANNVKVKTLKGIKGGTSPWTYFSEKYPDGQRVLLQSNATHFYKIVDDKQGLRIVAKVKIDSDWLKSFGWNLLQTKGNVWYTYDPKYNPQKGQTTKLFKITDSQHNNPYSRLVVRDTFDFKGIVANKVQNFGINYRGEIAFYSGSIKKQDGAVFGILSSNFDLLDTLRIRPVTNELFGHNAFPIDENNSMYVVTTHRLIRIDWDGEALKLGFEAWYDFVNDGPTGTFAEGSGTTPTLMGFGEGNDQLIIVADGHKRNNLLAFWRKIPGDWKGIKGEDIRLAGKIKLPAAKRFSNKFQSIENSPTVYGYDVAIAQFNGFLGQGKNPLKGVQKVHWNIEKNIFELAWVNTDINMNGVLTYSKGSNLVYGSGREEKCNYYYYGLDWDSGKLRFRKHLGKVCKWLKNPLDDGGCQQIIAEDGSIYYAGGASLVKLEKRTP